MQSMKPATCFFDSHGAILPMETCFQELPLRTAVEFEETPREETCMSGGLRMVISVACHPQKEVRI